MYLKQFTIGYISTNCYLIACEKTRIAAVIDPGGTEEEISDILRRIHDDSLLLKYIINTHGHADHISGNALMKSATGADILIHAADAKMILKPWTVLQEASKQWGREPPCPGCGQTTSLFEVLPDQHKAVWKCGACDWYFEALASPPADQLLADGDLINIGTMKFTVIHTPGHSAGSIALFCQEENVVFTGDTLFAGSRGRTDLPDSSEKGMLLSLRMLMELPEQTVVYAGHMGSTTIAGEKKNNPFILEL